MGPTSFFAVQGASISKFKEAVQGKSANSIVQDSIENMTFTTKVR